MELKQEDLEKTLRYYLWHLRLDLKLERMEFLRHNADRICAMLNGYITTRGKGAGKYEQFKLSCYASRQAVAQLKRNKWSAEGLRQEHVIPLKVVEQYLLKNGKKLSDWQLLNELNNIVIPCVITIPEDGLLLKQRMPDSCRDIRRKPWARYIEAKYPEEDKDRAGKSLFDEIVALRDGLPYPSGEDGNPPVGDGIKLPFKQGAMIPDFIVKNISKAADDVNLCGLYG